MSWKVRELAAEETHHLRRAVSADGRTDLPSMHHDLDDTAGADATTGALCARCRRALRRNGHKVRAGRARARVAQRDEHGRFLAGVSDP